MADRDVVMVPPDGWRLRIESGAAAGGAPGATLCIRKEEKSYGEMPRRTREPPASKAGCRGSRVLAPRVGFEPTTLRLTAGCSTIELPRNEPARSAARGAMHMRETR